MTPDGLPDGDGRDGLERALRLSEEKYSTAFELAPVGIVISDAETGKMLEVNARFEEIFGYGEEELLDRRSLELGLWEDPDRRTEIVDAVRRDGSISDAEAWHRSQDGTRIRTRLSCKRLELSSGDRLMWTVQDVTAEHRRRERLHLLQSAAQVTDHAMMVTDREGTVLWVNRAFTGLTGYAPREVLGRTPEVLKSGQQDEAFYREMWETILAGETWTGELVNRRKDGSLYLEEQSIVPVRHRSDRITHFVALKWDATEDRRRERALRESEELHRTLVETMAEAVVIVDGSGTIVFANHAVADLFGRPVEDVVGRPFDDREWNIRGPGGGPVPPGDLPVQRAMGTGEAVTGVELAIDDAEGQRRVVSVNAAALPGEDDEPAGMVVTIRDTTEEKHLEEQLRHQALHDSLTGVPNRQLFHDRLEQAAARSRRGGTSLAVVMTDIDRFKRVNDSLGHEAGDRVLQEAASRFRTALRDRDTVARIGGDEFALLLEEVSDRAGVRGALERVQAEFDRPFAVGGESFPLELSVGAVLFGPDASGEGVPLADLEARDLVRYADAAMYQAKADGSPGPRFLAHAEDLEQTPLLEREQALRQAVDAGDFEVHYQPVLDLLDGRVVGVEALARWRRGEGLVSPAEFIPLAEESGLIVPLGKQIFREAGRQVAAWNRELRPPEPIRLYANFSARQLSDDDLSAWMGEALREDGLDPGHVTVEVTETALMRSSWPTRELKELGIHLAVDDFGTGYASLTYLRRLEVDELKIDMSFVHGMLANPQDAAIVETIVSLCRTLDLTAVAEGIETEGQLEHLRGAGVHLGQGFHFTRPMPPGDTLAYLRSLPSGNGAGPGSAARDRDA